MFSILRVHLVMAAAFLSGAAPNFVHGQGDRSQTSAGEAGQLIAVLESDAPLQEKALACKRLAVVGTKEAVPTLAKLLSDEQLSHYARFALEANPDPSVDQTFRDALDRLEGQRLVGVINSIGSRKDTQAVSRLESLLSDSDQSVAKAAAAALGRIADAKSTSILLQSLSNVSADLRPAIGEAALACAQELAATDNREDAAKLYDTVRTAELPTHLRLAATRGAILTQRSAGIPLLVNELRSNDDRFFRAALRAARELKDKNVAQALLGELEVATPQRKALLILTLGDRADKSALPNVVEAAGQGPTDVRVAAIRSLGQIGDASVVPLLLQAAGEPDAQVADAAKASLVAISDEKVDTAILAAADSHEQETRRTAIGVLAERRVETAIPLLLEAADDEDLQIRLAAIKALGQTIELEQLSALTDRVISPKNPQERDAAHEALKAACRRMPDRDVTADRLAGLLADAPLQAKTAFLEVLGIVGGDPALQAVSASAKDSNQQVQDAATRVLGEWMSVDAAPVLLDLAKNLDNNRFKIRSLRGYIRIIRQLRLPGDEKLAMCREALNVAQRNNERKLVLEALRRLPSAEALSIAASQLDQGGLENDAAAAAIAIGERIRSNNPQAVAEAMRQISESNVSTDLQDRAKKLQQQAESQ